MRLALRESRNSQEARALAKTDDGPDVAIGA